MGTPESSKSLNLLPTNLNPAITTLIASNPSRDESDLGLDSPYEPVIQQVAEYPALDPAAEVNSAIRAVAEAIMPEAPSLSPLPYVAKSGTVPLMTKEKQAAQTRQSLALIQSMDDIPGASDPRYNDAREIIIEWGISVGRSLTPSELHCLVTALLTQSELNPEDFDKILLGYAMRGDHNIVECRNVLTAMQELMNNMISNHRSFKVVSEKILHATHGLALSNATPKGTKDPPPSGTLIPASKPKGVSMTVEPIPPSSVVVNRAIGKKVEEMGTRSIIQEPFNAEHPAGTDNYWANQVAIKTGRKQALILKVHSNPENLKTFAIGHADISSKGEYWTAFLKTFSK